MYILFLKKYAEYIYLYIYLLTRYIYLYILTDMKKILISVDDDIVEILEGAENKSAYIRKAILAEQDNNLTQEVRRLAMLTDGLVNDMSTLIQKIDTIKQPASIRADSAKADDSFVPLPPDPEKGYPCCTKSTPCKHWAWDGMESCWKNTLTGRTRDA